MNVREGEEERGEVGGDGVVRDLPELEKQFDGFVAREINRTVVSE